MSEPTKGPWKLDVVGREGNPNDPRHCRIVGTAIGRHVVIADTLNCSCVFSPDDQEANARLIASAPDMLAALRPFAEWARQYELNTAGGVRDEVMLASLQRARAAVAKAEGRAP